MFEQLFKQPCALLRHQNAPLAAERASFLSKRVKDGVAPSTLMKLARELFVIVQELDLSKNEMITPLAIEMAAERWARQQKYRHRAQSERWSQILFRQTATAWLQFLGRLAIPKPEPQPFASLVEHFINYLQNERGLSSVTVVNYQWHIEKSHLVQHTAADFLRGFHCGYRCFFCLSGAALVSSLYCYQREGSQSILSICRNETMVSFWNHRSHCKPSSIS